MRLKDIYRPDTVTINLDDDLAAAARRMELAQVGALAVVDEAGRLVGIFTERDLVRATARAANPAACLVSAHASFRPKTADVEEDSRDVARRMLELGVRHLPVTAGDDQLAGTGLTSKDPREIIRAAEDGRIDTLFAARHPAGRRERRWQRPVAQWGQGVA